MASTKARSSVKWCVRAYPSSLPPPSHSLPLAPHGPQRAAALDDGVSLSVRDRGGNGSSVSATRDDLLELQDSLSKRIVELELQAIERAARHSAEIKGAFASMREAQIEGLTELAKTITRSEGGGGGWDVDLSALRGVQHSVLAEEDSLQPPPSRGRQNSCTVQEVPFRCEMPDNSVTTPLPGHFGRRDDEFSA